MNENKIVRKQVEHLMLMMENNCAMLISLAENIDDTGNLLQHDCPFLQNLCQSIVNYLFYCIVNTSTLGNMVE